MLKSRVRALLVRPCSNVALLCNHDNKELKEDVDGCVGSGGVELVHDLLDYHICSVLLFCVPVENIYLYFNMLQLQQVFRQQLGYSPNTADTCMVMRRLCVDVRKRLTLTLNLFFFVFCCFDLCTF